MHPARTHSTYFWWNPQPQKQEILEKMWWWCHHHIFSGISCFWGSGFCQKYAEWVLVGCEIKFRIQRVPTQHTFDRPLYPKNKKYQKKCDAKVCRVSTRWMQNLISHPTSSHDRNLSKNTGRYVENTNKNNSFFMIPIPKFILKFCLRPIGYFKFKAISFANTWWHGIWIMVKRPILSWNFL